MFCLEKYFTWKQINKAVIHIAQEIAESFAVSVSPLIFCSTHPPVTPEKDDLQILTLQYVLCWMHLVL